MLIRIDLVKTISSIDGIKGLHTNCRLASCFVSYANEHQIDYHGFTWCKVFVLLVLCAVNPLLTGGFPYARSTMLFALLVERWCLIKGFCIAGPVCGVSICSKWIPVISLLSLCAVKSLVTNGFPLQGITGMERWWSSVRWFHRRWISLTQRSAWCFLSCLPV